MALDETESHSNPASEESSMSADRGKRKIIELHGVTVTVKSLKFSRQHFFKIDNFTIIKDVSFYSYEGEILGLIGESGAGKSTILRCITGQWTPTSGTVSVAGIDVVHHRREAAKRFGYVPQLDIVGTCIILARCTCPVFLTSKSVNGQGNCSTFSDSRIS